MNVRAYGTCGGFYSAASADARNYGTVGNFWLSAGGGIVFAPVWYQNSSLGAV